MTDLQPIADFYGKWARVYSVLARWTPGIRTVRKRAIDSLALSRGDIVIDLGCGTGANFGFLRERVGSTGKVVGIDVTPGMLEYAGRRIVQEDWDNVHVHRGDARSPSVSVADAVLGTFVTGMFRNPAAVVSAWCDLLSPNGRFALLDATILPEETNTVLRWLFGGFVYLSAPEQSRRNSSEMVTELSDRVTEGHGALADLFTEIHSETLLLGTLHVCTGTKPRS